MSSVRINLALTPELTLEQKKLELQQELLKEEEGKSEALSIIKKSSILYSKDEVALAIDKVAKEILEKFRHTPNLVFVTILEGAAKFAVMVKARLFELDPEFLYRDESMKIARYGSAEQGKVPVITLMPSKIEGRTLVCLEDLIDEGISIKFAREKLLEAGAKEVHFVTLMDKLNKNVDFKAAHKLTPVINGLNEKGDPWVGGLGMDFVHQYGRHFPHIVAKKNESEQKEVISPRMGMALVSSSL